MPPNKQIILTSDLKDEIKVDPLQFSTQSNGALEFLNQSEKTLTVTFKRCHPFPTTESELTFLPRDELSLRMSEEIHFSYDVSQGGTGPGPLPRPRVAIITILQPVAIGKTGSTPYGFQEESHTGPIIISFVQKENQVQIEPPIADVQPGKEVTFVNRTQQLLTLSFLASSPFLESDQAFQFVLANSKNANKVFNLVPTYLFRVSAIDSQDPLQTALGQLRANLG